MGSAIPRSLARVVLFVRLYYYSGVLSAASSDKTRQNIMVTKLSCIDYSPAKAPYTTRVGVVYPLKEIFYSVCRLVPPRCPR